MATLGPLKDVRNFSQLLPIVKKAESKLSFLGNRYVCIGREDETIDFKELVAYVNVVLDKKREMFTYERNYLKQISKLINRLYKVSDEQIATFLLG